MLAPSTEQSSKSHHYLKEIICAMFNSIQVDIDSKMYLQFTQEAGLKMKPYICPFEVTFCLIYAVSCVSYMSGIASHVGN